MMSMVSVVSQGRRTALLTGIFSAAVVSMVSRVIDHASSGSSDNGNAMKQYYSTLTHIRLLPAGLREAQQCWYCFYSVVQ